MPSDFETEVKELMKHSLETNEKRLVAALGPPSPDLEEFYHNIPLSDGYEIRAKIFRPKSALTSPRPLILFFHGGGFGGGTCEQGTRPGREFALEFDAVVVSATYRLSPEYKFPQSHLDGVDVVRWLDGNAEEVFGADLSAGFVVGGHSAGGSVAAVAVSEARTLGLQYPVTGAFVCISVFFVEETVPEKYKWLFKSTEEFGEGLMGKKALEGMFAKMEADTKSQLFNPMFHPLGLEGLPPTYLQMGGKDMLRDDGVVYERLLQDAGVPTKMDIYPELFHEAWSIWTKDDALTSEELKTNTMAALRWLLKK